MLLTIILIIKYIISYFLVLDLDLDLVFDVFLFIGFFDVERLVVDLFLVPVDVFFLVAGFLVAVLFLGGIIILTNSNEFI